jgi:hypothetical protein
VVDDASAGSCQTASRAQEGVDLQYLSDRARGNDRVSAQAQSLGAERALGWNGAVRDAEDGEAFPGEVTHAACFTRLEW